MNNRKITIWIIASILALFFVIKTAYSFLFSEGGFEITIKNRTDIQISGLSITYMSITEDVVVPYIKPQAEVKVHIKPTERFGENRMSLYYFDNSGERREIIIFGYFEMGYSGKSWVDIKSADKNGNLTFTVKEELFDESIMRYIFLGSINYNENRI